MYIHFHCNIRIPRAKTVYTCQLVFAGCKDNPNCQIISLSWWYLVTSYLKVRQCCFQRARAHTGVAVIHFNMGLLFREKKNWRQIPSPLISPATSHTNKQAQWESFLLTATSSPPPIQHRMRQACPSVYAPLLFNGFHSSGNFTSGLKFLDSSF